MELFAKRGQFVKSATCSNEHRLADEVLICANEYLAIMHFKKLFKNKSPFYL